MTSSGLAGGCTAGGAVSGPNAHSGRSAALAAAGSKASAMTQARVFMGIPRSDVGRTARLWGAYCRCDNATRARVPEDQRISRKSLPSDLIRGGHRFSDKDMRHSMNLERVPIPQERNML